MHYLPVRIDGCGAPAIELETSVLELSNLKNKVTAAFGNAFEINGLVGIQEGSNTPAIPEHGVLYMRTENELFSPDGLLGYAKNLSSSLVEGETFSVSVGFRHYPTAWSILTFVQFFFDGPHYLDVFEVKEGEIVKSYSLTNVRLDLDDWTLPIIEYREQFVRQLLAPQTFSDLYGTVGFLEQCKADVDYHCVNQVQ
ncbi:hypothetical protein DRW07_06690 [Alteromonas sediminis]|uniref:Uncharacterized protein n=1 Tax=Alteromonas sediminis TaxID=2259342 RepID=A0A3N5Y0K5_9ALTE|nr:hypothetical protein [Alteromonas sediminis]RPJ67217.1 hypothetical protein DRW07_06690 [Alteromonas sediminis]